MKFEAAQKDMNFSYFGGGTGVFVSGFVWCIAGLVALMLSNQSSMLTLFFGGMFIHPLSMLFSKALKRPGNHTSENPLGKLALESTVILFIGLFLALYISTLRVEWFYPVMLMAVGARYLIFNTLYGTRIYWLLGALLILSGMLRMLLGANFIVGSFIGGIIEILFSVLIINQSKSLVLNIA